MHRTRLLSGALSALLLATAACGREAARIAQAGGTVDSVVPREVALARFQRGLARPDSLAGTLRSRAALVAAFARAVESRDTASLRRMVMTREEFAYLLYPTSPQGLPPYDLSPALMWFALEGRSRQGIATLLEEHGGRRLAVIGLSCDPVPSREGDNTLWGPCVVRRLRAPADTVSERLFGLIVERGGRFKFVSYANQLS